VEKKRNNIVTIYFGAKLQNIPVKLHSCKAPAKRFFWGRTSKHSCKTVKMLNDDFSSGIRHKMLILS
jgi:hypothetical protein